VNNAPLSYSGEHEMCRYRCPDGSRCAIGIFISDELYDPEIEQTALVYEDARAAILACVEPDARDHVELLTVLQTAHDDASVRERHSKLKAGLKRIAKNEDLQIPQ